MRRCQNPRNNANRTGRMCQSQAFRFHHQGGRIRLLSPNNKRINENRNELARDHGPRYGPAHTCAAAATTQQQETGTASFDYFKSLVESFEGPELPNWVPLYSRIMGDQLTPILAYKSLVQEDKRDAPSFLFESVVNGTQQGRYSFVGAHPSLEIIAKGHHVEVLDHGKGSREEQVDCADPLAIPEDLSKHWHPATPLELPRVFTGGWVGYCGYDTVRYVYQGKLPFEHAPADDRNLPDMHLALYTNTVLFDHATKLAYVVSWVNLDEFDSLESAYDDGKQRLDKMIQQLQQPPNLAFGQVDLSLQQRPKKPENSNFTEEKFMEAIAKTKEHILSGDVFQLVLSQRFERKTHADPFEVYRALRVVNPSPYMAYLQSRESIIVSSSPEILCRVEENRRVTNRPLAGTRRRGSTTEEDLALEQDLLQDEKELAEHVMLVDLGRNDVGKVAKAGSVNVDRLMEIERYSHVMHISSTVTGQLKPELSCWDALRAALPAGTVSGAPKVRAMQILDELENSKRGPYGGGFGHVSFTGGMDMALALRTMVVVNDHEQRKRVSTEARPEWTIHLQAGAGVVMDSVPESEFEETVNKAAALGRAIDLAESSFVDNVNT